MPMRLYEPKETAAGLIGLIAEHVELLAPELRRWWIRLSVAWFGILSLCVLLTWSGLLMKSEAVAHLYWPLALELAAAMFIVPFVVLPIAFWVFLWAVRIVVLCIFALRFLVWPPR
jgi:hypothetical protein